MQQSRYTVYYVIHTIYFALHTASTTYRVLYVIVAQLSRRCSAGAPQDRRASRSLVAAAIVIVVVVVVVIVVVVVVVVMAMGMITAMIVVQW